MDIIEIPNEWRDLLSQIQAVDPSAIIAGGAVRDWILARQPRDIDIFVKRLSEDDINALNLAIVEGTYIESAEHDDSVSASGCYNGHSLPVNIIWCSTSITPKERFERFDFGICKAAFDGKEVITHPEFDWDVKHQIFTLRRASNYLQTIESLIRYNRLREKYPYPLMIPSDLKLPFRKDRILG